MDKLEVVSKAGLGFPGRMISGSKSGYHRQKPNNLVVFNANICVQSGKIWHGDLDITLDIEVLKKVSGELQSPIFILYEHDGRFENEEKPLLDKYVVKINPDGTYEIGKEYKEYYSDDLQKIKK